MASVKQARNTISDGTRDPGVEQVPSLDTASAVIAANRTRGTPVSYVFISYSHHAADQSARTRVVAWLEANGYPFWWDDQMYVGAAHHKELTERLRGSAAVIVIWSDHSITSDYVLDEADRGRRAGRLLPVADTNFEISKLLVGFGAMNVVRVDNLDKLKQALQRFGIEPQPKASLGTATAAPNTTTNSTVGAILDTIARKLRLRIGFGTAIAVAAAVLAYVLPGFALLIVIAAALMAILVLTLTS